MSYRAVQTPLTRTLKNSIFRCLNYESLKPTRNQLAKAKLKKKPEKIRQLKYSKSKKLPAEVNVTYKSLLQKLNKYH